MKLRVIDDKDVGKYYNLNLFTKILLTMVYFAFGIPLIILIMTICLIILIVVCTAMAVISPIICFETALDMLWRKPHKKDGQLVIDSNK